ncbi:MAG: PEP-CTERM sorting domain-containing protein [Acetobacteraceae bacterium]|nr:PEP-CTERM sorting domain-containing protein [Acetobacteraceae bacterium]
MGRTKRDMYSHSYLLLSNIALSVAVLGFGACLTRPAVAAPTLVFDRGLPTENLNNAAGDSRSNVSWADTGTTQSIGDTFTLSGVAGTNYSIDTIRVWIVADAPVASSFSLWFGADAGAGTVVQLVSSATPSISAVTYANGQTYQGSNGSYYGLYELDFSGVGILATPGTYAFSVSGSDGSAPSMNTPYLHASNADLSGSTQMGPNDGLIYGFTSTGSMDNGYPWASIGGWNKPSDINVQVFADVPEPSALAIFGLGLAVFGIIRRRGTV